MEPLFFEDLKESTIYLIILLVFRFLFFLYHMTSLAELEFAFH